MSLKGFSPLRHNINNKNAQKTPEICLFPDGSNLDMDPEDAAYWTGLWLYKHCSLTVEEHQSQHLHNLCAARMKFLGYCITKDGQFGWQWVIPAAVAGTVKTWNYIPKKNQNALSKFCTIFYFQGNIFYLFQTVKKPPKRTVTFIYKLDRKRLCILINKSSLRG